MIRDAKGYATEIAQISPDLRDKMILVIRDRIIRNLLAIKQLVVIGGYDDICGGLYTYVVEEYGKILFLKSLPVGNDGKIEFKYRFGFRDHQEKFDRALKALPESCTKIHQGEFSNEFASEDFNTDVKADFETRMGIFYTDFKTEKGLLDPPAVNKKLIETATEDLLKLISNQSLP
jgi:AbiV family abortive infection protein